MPLTVTATPDPTTASVVVEVTGAVPAAGPVSITRTDRNGTAPVRQREDSLPVAGALTIEDYEAALAGGITYTVRDSSGAAATVTLPAGLAVTVPWLSHPGLPALNRPVTIRDDDPTYSGRSVQHDVYGARLPLFTTQPLTGRDSSTLTLLADSWDDARGIRDVYASGVPVLLRQPCLDDGDHYHVPSSVALAPVTAGRWAGRWSATVTYVETDRPLGALAGTARWTYADSLARSGTYPASRAEFPTYADLLAGPTPGA